MLHQALRFGQGDLPELAKVRLVPDQQLHDVGASVLPHVLDPMRHRQKGAPLGDVVSKNGPVSAAVVALGDGAEALLAGSVPDLQLHTSGGVPSSSFAQVPPRSLAVMAQGHGR